jgi:hypothetical protein
MVKKMKNKMKNKIILIILLIGAPLLTFFIPSTLSGVTEKTPFPAFSAAAFLDKSFQNKFDAWYNEVFGLRGLYITINNQLYYALFRKSYMKGGIVIGKKGYLYEDTYIRCYLNTNLDQEGMAVFCRDFRTVQDRLARRGICSALCITPSKVAVYPEYVPDRYFNRFRRDAPPLQARDALVPLLEKYGINYINCAEYVKEKKNENPVFSRGGTHWNDLGKYYGTDYFIRELESYSGRKYRGLKLDSLHWDSTPSGEDIDLASYLNLLICPRFFKVPHVTLGAVSPASAVQPRVLIVGSSFSGGLIETLSKIEFYDTLHYYYYLKRTHRVYENGKETSRVENPPGEPEEYLGEVLSKDILILEFNEYYAHNINKDFTRAFIDAALKTF